MRVTKKRTIASLLLGTSLCLIYSVLFREIPYFEKLELNTYDTLLRSTSIDKPPEEILLVRLNQKYRDSRIVFPSFSERVFYASLVKQLLEHDAAVVVLNLRHHWRDIPDNDWQDADLVNAPLQDLVTEYSEQIVLVTPTDSLSDIPQPELQVYRHFLPLEDDLSEPFAPNYVQGFSEYEPKANRPVTLTNIARHINLSGKFVGLDHLKLKQSFYSAPLLALKKFERQQNNYYLDIEALFPENIGVNYWKSNSNFNALNIEQICVQDAVAKCQLDSEVNLRSHVANKIVLLGFSEGRNLDTLPVMTAFDQEIPLVEYQANVLASLLTGRYYRVLPVWSLWLIRLVGAIIVSGILIFNIDLSRLDLTKNVFLILLGLIGVYFGLTFILWQSYYTLPVIIPLSIWSASAISTSICIYLESQRKLIGNQRQKIKQLQRAEEKAVILQTRKLLQRVASDIHDTALQDLKVLMDKLELESNLDSEFVIDHLELIGSQIREQLHSMRQMSQKLEVSLILRSGLGSGIRANLKQLVDSDQLILEIIDDLHPINEPIANSAWIDAREDIYRFFREAINNVVFHAQAPHGNATQVKVSMWCKQDRCYLIITDNNSQTSVNLSAETPLKQSISKGYGTKIMETIACELPEGAWERTIIPQKGTKVQLSWSLSLKNKIHT